MKKFVAQSAVETQSIDSEAVMKLFDVQNSEALLVSNQKILMENIPSTVSDFYFFFGGVFIVLRLSVKVCEKWWCCHSCF